MSTPICAICGKAATQKHHISYDPEILIDVCVKCHKWIHKNEHGVGLAKLPKSTQKELQKAKPHQYDSKHHIKDTNLDPPVLLSKETGEELQILLCPHCKNHNWIITIEPTTEETYLLCPCGYDRRLKIG